MIDHEVQQLRQYARIETVSSFFQLSLVDSALIIKPLVKMLCICTYSVLVSWKGGLSTYFDHVCRIRFQAVMLTLTTKRGRLSVLISAPKGLTSHQLSKLL